MRCDPFGCNAAGDGIQGKKEKKACGNETGQDGEQASGGEKDHPDLL